MFKKMSDYILLSKEERQHHLVLDEACVEIGGRGSAEYRGLLAHFLQTEIPAGRKVFLCHACNNERCSNVHHLYWGTPQENTADCVACGRSTRGWLALVAKHGEETMRERLRAAGSKGGKAGGGLNKLSNEEIQVRLSIIKQYYPSRGWMSKSARELNMSHTQIKRFAKQYLHTS